MKIILLILILIYNLCINCYAIYTYNDEDYKEEVLHKPIFIRIPHIIWYWLESIYRFGLIPYLIRLIFSGIISVLIIKLSIWLPTKSIEAFAILYLICVFNCGIMLTYFYNILYRMFKYLYSKRKRK